MPSEVSIAKPLSGVEVREALLNAFTKAISRDDRLGSHMAYTGFRATIRLAFHPAHSFIPPLETTAELAEGDLTDISETPIEVEVEMPIAPPNQVRIDAGLPTPVLVTDDKGRSSEKWVKSGPVPSQPKHLGRR